MYRPFLPLFFGKTRLFIKLRMWTFVWKCIKQRKFRAAWVITFQPHKIKSVRLEQIEE